MRLLPRLLLYRTWNYNRLSLALERWEIKGCEITSLSSLNIWFTSVWNSHSQSPPFTIDLSCTLYFATEDISKMLKYIYISAHNVSKRIYISSCNIYKSHFFSRNINYKFWCRHCINTSNISFCFQNPKKIADVLSS